MSCSRCGDKQARSASDGFRRFAGVVVDGGAEALGLGGQHWSQAVTAGQSRGYGSRFPPPLLQTPDPGLADREGLGDLAVPIPSSQAANTRCRESIE